jgi:hypothetical protein
VCRGGRRLARTRHHREEAGLTQAGWREHWEAARLFITADGETDKAWGNEPSDFTPVNTGSRSSSPPPSPIWPTGPTAATSSPARLTSPTAGTRSPPRPPPAPSARRLPRCGEGPLVSRRVMDLRR